MAEGIADCMPLALRSVGDAIGLDSENRTKEAYCQYLSCMIYISQVLKDDAWDKDLRLVYNRDTAKLFRLLQQCQERALTIISTLASGALPTQNQNQKPRHLQPPSDGLQRRYSDSSIVNTDQSDQSHLVPPSGVPHKLSDTAAPASTLSTPSVDGYLHLPSPPGSPVPHHRRTGSYDPLERAYRENEHLIAAYRARMQNANKGRRNKDVISKNLSLMRRMSENLVIAKAREEAIKKKLLERQLRLQEETNKRFGPAVLFTKEQQEQRILYTKILEFEQETVWPKHLREKLKLMPTNAKLIKDIITKIFCSADHPLTQFLLQYQYHVYRKLAPLVKDVGFPDVKSGKRATSKGTYIALNEAHSDEKPAEAIDSVHLDEGDRGNQKDDTGSLRQSEDGENLSFTFHSEGTVNDTKEVTKEKSKEESSNAFESNDVASDRGDTNIAKNVHGEGLSSSTDLEQLKNLLDKGVPTDTSVTEDGQVDAPTGGQDSSAMEGTDEPANLDSYFQELEDDMFGWESNGDENDDDDKESSVVDDTDNITSEETNCENREASNTQNLEWRTKDPNEPTGVNDEACSSELDSLKCEKENSPDEANTDDSPAPEQIEPLKEKEIEPENVDRNKSIQPLGDVDPLETNQFIRSRDEQCSNIDHKEKAQQMEPITLDVTPSIRVNEEASEVAITPDTPETSDEGENQLMEAIADDAIPNNDSNEDASPAPYTPDTPDDERESEAEVDNKGESQMPKSSLFEESSGKNENDSVKKEDLPPSDEVRKQLKDILVDVRFFLEKLQNLLILAYRPLDTPAGRDLCYSCVEFPFFKPLWPMLLAVLRQVNFEKEVCLADVMSANIAKGPFDLGVPQRLCMEDQGVLDSTGNKYPYHLAVEELHKVVTLFCPLEKLECIVRTSRCICQCVEDYWESKGKPRHSPETAIGCDDLLPILSFVIIRSGMAQLVSECDAMEEFIPEGYLMGEEGYCLTTLLTALAYLATLKPT